MGATLTSVNNITKEIYGPKIVDQMENEITLVKRIEKSSAGVTDEVGGKYVTFPLKVRRNHGIGYRNELEQLQTPGQQGWQSVRVPLRYGYGRVHMSGQAMKLAEKNMQAFTSAMTAEMDGLKTDLAKDTNRILWGNQTGLLFSFGAAGPTNTLTITSGFQHAEVGLVIDIMDESALPATIAVTRTVTAVNNATSQITIDGAAVTVAAADFAVRTGNYAKEPHGLRSLVTNTTTSLFNLSSSTEPLWQSEIDALNGVISESRMVQMADRLRTNGGRPTVIFTDLASRRAYFNLLTTQRRFSNTKDFGGGFSGLSFTYDDDIPVMTDIDAPAGEMFFLREDDFKVYQESDWSWEDTDGDVWKWVTNFDAFEALMKKYWEFAIHRRNTQGRITGITAG
jgi:hypothetical protein